MNLSPAQGKLIFAVIVLVLAGLGVFLLLPHPSTPRAAAAPGPTARAAPSAAPATSPGLDPPAATAPAADPSPSQAAPPVNIYRLLPFSQADLGRAVTVTTRFAEAYGTYSYHLDAAGYVATMHGLVTPALAATLARGYATAGVAKQRARDRQVASATASVTGLRAFGPSSMTLVVRLEQTISGTAGRSTLTTQYAVTLTLVHASWQVSDIELASAGNS